MRRQTRKTISYSTLFLLFLLVLYLGEIYPLTSLLGESKSSENRQSMILTGIKDSGELSIFFCPRDDCENRLRNLLQQANSSLHCALYDLDLESVKALLTEKASQLDVRIVMDDKYYHKFNKSFVKTDRHGEMHNKFCIIDQKILFAGSMNPTINDAHKNNNNIIITTIPSLIQNYEDEFQELWNGTFKKGSTVRTPVMFVNETIIQNYFCPEDHCADHILTELEKAQTSIYFMTFSFTHEQIENMLLFKHIDNLTVQGVIETRMATKDSPLQRFITNGISMVKDGNPRTMHHKVFIIDKKTTITGSMNPTNNGNKNNDENLLIIQNEALAKAYFEEYQRVRAEAEMLNSSS